MNDFNTQIQCDEDRLSILDDFLEWIDQMEGLALDFRDADDVHWEDIRENIEREFIENQPKPF